MAHAVLMPKAGISVESCIVGQWKKQPGDPVTMGEVLFDCETDKASFECESTAEGTLLEIFYGAGDEVPVLTAVCAVGQAGEDVSTLRPGGGGGQPAKARAESPAPLHVANFPLSNGGEPPSSQAGITPRAKALAAQMQVDPDLAAPTGPQGRILARDVQALAGTAPAAAPAETPQTQADPAQCGYIDLPMSGIRKSIARTMHASLQDAAQLTHHHSFDATALLALRKQFKNSGEELGLGEITVGDLILFAVSRTLLRHPALNTHMLEDGVLRRWKEVHLGVAVDTDRGLMVPTVFGADQKSLGQISAEVRDLAAKARSGSICPDLLQGGTFTVSNLGALGVESFTPILNPPQVGILGVCGLVPRVREGEGGIKVYQTMGLSLTYDHRAVDGAPASRFAAELCRNLENIQLLLAM